MRNKIVTSLVSLAFAATLFSSAAASSAAAASSKATPPSSNAGVYSDKASFNVAAKNAQTRGAFSVVPPGHDKQRRTFLNELAKLSPTDAAGMDKLAKKYRQLIYNPNLNPKMMSIEGDVTINQPYISIDTYTGDKGVIATAQWNSSAPIWSDTPFFGNNLGGPDSVGLSFSQLTQMTTIREWGLDTYDDLGRLQAHTTTRYSTPNSPDGRNAIVLRFQDTWLGTQVGTCTCWRMMIHVYFTYHWTETGNVQMTYAHDWKSTQLTSIGWNIAGSADSDTKKTISSGLQFGWNYATEKWAGEGLYTSY